MRISITGWLVAAASVGAVVVLGPDVTLLSRDLTGPSFPDAAVAAASLLVLGIASWSLLVVMAVVLGASSRVVATISPVALRRTLLAGAAGALSIAPAHAEVPDDHVTRAHAVDGLALPDRPDAPEPSTTVRQSSTVAAAPDEPAAPDEHDVAQVRVRVGDSLWAIAARSLPPDSSAADIAAATVRWHRTNVDVIGADPDVIVPDQILVPPPKDTP